MKHGLDYTYFPVWYVNSRTFHHNGNPHFFEMRTEDGREGPVDVYNSAGQLISSLQYVTGELRSITYYYYQNDMQQEEREPSIITWYSNMQIKSIMYKLYDLLHYAKGPAYVIWYKTGVAAIIEYRLNGLRCSVNGLSEIALYPNGEIDYLNY